MKYQLWGAPPPPHGKPMYIGLCTTSQDVPQNIQRRLINPVLPGVNLKVAFQFNCEWTIILPSLLYLWLLPEDHDVTNGFSFEKVKYVTGFFLWKDQPLFPTRDEPNTLTCYATFATPVQVQHARDERARRLALRAN